jgi:hypothetical protein
MPLTDYLIMMGIGGLFVVLGSVSVVWGRIREKSCGASLSGRHDVREYMEGEWKPQFESVKIAGWIAITIGILLLALGGAFWLTG